MSSIKDVGGDDKPLLVEDLPLGETILVAGDGILNVTSSRQSFFAAKVAGTLKAPTFSLFEFGDNSQRLRR